MSPIVKYPRIPKLSARHVVALVLMVLAYGVFEFNRGFELKKALNSYEAAKERNDPEATIMALDEIMRLNGKDAAGFVNRAFYHAEQEKLPPSHRRLHQGTRY